MIERRPLFPNMVRSADSVDRVLKSGSNSRKLGSHFSKGADWRGMPIFSLSLPERESCPERPCWSFCYGNRMQIAPRFKVDSTLKAKLTVEIENLADCYPDGFAIRLHALGDFQNLSYTKFWIAAVRAVEPLHVFGFTAHSKSSPIGALIDAESRRWDRFRIRFSFGRGQRSASVMIDPPWGRHARGVTCPADTDNEDITCGSCALCLNRTDHIVFKQH
jgi:hypothetical protein